MPSPMPAKECSVTPTYGYRLSQVWLQALLHMVTAKECSAAPPMWHAAMPVEPVTKT